MIRCAIYARVSTSDQHCELQLTDLRRYAAARGWEIFGEYVDHGVSGAKASRPELNRLMSDARKRKFDAVAVWKIDRWGRSIAATIASIQELTALGVRWVSVTQNMDTDESNPMARFLLHVMAAFAELEREIIRERSVAGSMSYRQDYEAGKVGTVRHSKSGKNLPVGRPRRVFRRDAAREMRQAGASWTTIASALGVPVGTVREACR